MSTIETVVEITSCDDETLIFETWSTDEIRVLEKLATLTRKYGGGCKPVLNLRSYDPVRDEGWDDC